MRYQGRLSDWNDHKGFGFVTPHGGGDRAFVHISAFAQQTRRPRDGEIITYAIERDAHKRLNATQVRWADRTTAARTEQRRSGLPRKTLAAVSMLALAAATLMHVVPVIVPLWYAAASLVTLLIYAMDKSAAQRNQWRIPESSLHLLALIGGWPGALLAQEIYRHKCSKAAFQLRFWLTVALNVSALILAVTETDLMAALAVLFD
ncbi:cold shock and DUF1294 domain-containing protein [Xanthomonas campestris pv. paulliniae]|uniref:DUF1294 domain-containing protein n=1 Tax=Xanthomonas euvesicatoria TaxID=456327 RepID=UPI001C480058|nr:cold shock and DUF1294 domain-containing protein [Xanthomonas euvesicatoria]MBV6847137.1 cold shock and DUF1294 domain-containing protein [Xanthomonas campestris pv. paulliniae]